MPRGWNGRASALAVDDGIWEFDMDVKKSTAPLYSLSDAEVGHVVDEVMEAVSLWQEKACLLGLSNEIGLMGAAFTL